MEPSIKLKPKLITGGKQVIMVLIRVNLRNRGELSRYYRLKLRGDVSRQYSLRSRGHSHGARSFEFDVFPFTQQKAHGGFKTP